MFMCQWNNTNMFFYKKTYKKTHKGVNMKFSDKLRLLREEKNESINTAAEGIKIGVTTLRNYECQWIQKNMSRNRPQPHMTEW